MTQTPGPETARPDGPTLEYAAAPQRRGAGGAWSVVGLGLSLAGAAYVACLAAQVWWYVHDGMPVEVVLNAQWFLFPVLGAGVSLVGLWQGRWRRLAGCGAALAAASVVTLFLMAGRWGGTPRPPRPAPGPPAPGQHPDAMTTATTQPPIPLAYEGGVSRERLPDGSLRLTVVTRRSRALMALSAAGGLAFCVAAVSYLLGSQVVPYRWVLFGFLGLPLCLGTLLAVLLTPKQQTHVVEAGPAGLRIQTTVSGDRVDRSHPRAEIISVRVVGSSIQIRTARDFYQAITFGDRKVLKHVATTINAELNAEPNAGPKVGPSFDRT